MIDSKLSNIVQENCHIADAQFAGEYTLCVYLLKMREFYRWEKKLGFNDHLPKDDVGQWLSEREALWSELEEADYRDITLSDQTFSPFHADDINAQLVPQGLVYSGGLGHQMKPHFFLARLLKHHQIDDYQIYIANEELARDLTATPAMSRDKTIFIRRESLRRMLWERIEEWRWKRAQGAMSRALDYYDFDEDLDSSLDAMTDHEVDVLLHHEIGEIRADKLLGEAWHELIAALPRSEAEMMAHAVRDHLADCLSTLPMLIEQERHASLHFYIGNLRGMRKQLFPALLTAYEQWQESGDISHVQSVVDAGALHWQQVAEQILQLFAQQGPACQSAISDYVKTQIR